MVTRDPDMVSRIIGLDNGFLVFRIFYAQLVKRMINILRTSQQNHEIPKVALRTRKSARCISVESAS